MVKHQLFCYLYLHICKVYITFAPSNFTNKLYYEKEILSVSPHLPKDWLVVGRRIISRLVIIFCGCIFEFHHYNWDSLQHYDICHDISAICCLDTCLLIARETGRRVHTGHQSQVCIHGCCLCIYSQNVVFRCNPLYCNVLSRGNNRQTVSLFTAFNQCSCIGIYLSCDF